MSGLAPPEDTIERWAFDYVSSTSLAHKLCPPAPPTSWDPAPRKWSLDQPGRPPALKPRESRRKTPRPGALKDVRKRAEVLHTFLHHELQAAELLLWAVLQFPDTPLAFRKGLVGIARDELRHIALYRDHLETLGSPFGSFPINDWFWFRVPQGVTRPAEFVARLAVGFEGGNLDHGARYTEYFRAAGDETAARLQAQIVAEEVPHAAFGLHWLAQLTGAVDFDAWRALLPVPLSPLMTRGLPLNLEARRKAGYPEPFLDRLAAWSVADGQ